MTRQPLDNAYASTSRSFDGLLSRHGLKPLTRSVPTTLQINVGKRCNQTCRHCHVDAGPTRTEMMTRDTAERILRLLHQSPAIQTVDITGGAPELNPCFRMLVQESRSRGRHVMDRCNLTVLLLPGQEDTAHFLADHQVEIVASLPCYGPDNVDQQRGDGVFDASITALQMLNALGYGQPDGDLHLNLVYNPIGAFLPPGQEGLQAAYKQRLMADFGIVFNELFTITNMPINRFRADLKRQGALEPYMKILADNFNPGAVPGLMCNDIVSIGWDGQLYDCDFNQMLDLHAGSPHETIWDIDDLGILEGAPIATGRHCLGCTAGAGSSCGGALA